MAASDVNPVGDAHRHQSNSAAQGPFRVGAFIFEPLSGELNGPSGTVHLEPKVVGVLQCLAARAGAVVTRDQLIAEVWGGRPVSDEVLSRCISLLRAAFGDDPRKPAYIRTVPKVGYRLVADVTGPVASKPLATATGAGAAERPRSVRRRSLLWSAVAAVLFLSTGALLYRALVDMVPVPVSPAPATLAVLPFTDLTADGDSDYLSDGLTEDLIHRLAALPDLQVVGSASAFAFKDRTSDLPTAATALGVRHVLHGSVRRDGERLRITAALIDADTGLVQWSDTFDRAFGDIFSVQDEISGSIVESLRPRFAASGAEALADNPPTRVMPAYELVLRGRHHLRTREPGPIRRSIELFNEAIGLDPHFGDAYGNLARAYTLLPTYAPEENPETLFERASDVLERGEIMDPSLHERVYDVRAFLHYSRWEWLDAEEDFRRALAETPNDPDLHQWYSQQLAAVGKPELGLQEVLKARELDMLSAVINQRLALLYLWVDDDAHAARQFALAQELGLGSDINPEGYLLLLIRNGEYDRAGAALETLQRATGRETAWIAPFIRALQEPAAVPAAVNALRAAAAAGDIHPKYLQGALVYLREADAAMDVAFKLLRDPVNFEVEFLFARENEILRRHPRFGELVRRIGLDAYWDVYGWPGFCARQGEAIKCR